MNDRTFKKPGRVEQARQRLDAAIERLEHALAEPSAGATASAPEPDRASVDERAALQDENARLRAANENVSERLDATIGRLERLLNE